MNSVPMPQNLVNEVDAIGKGLHYNLRGRNHQFMPGSGASATLLIFYETITLGGEIRRLDCVPDETTLFFICQPVTNR